MARRAADTAIERLHREYAGALFVYVLRRVGDRRLAEEVVQDTLVRAWQQRSRYDPERGSPGAWLFTIARNRTTDVLRRQGARPREVPLADREVLTDAQVDRALEAWQVAEALHGLSDAHRQAIVEVHYLGHTVEEVARRHDVPPGTVKSRLYYGLRALRLALDEMGVTR